MIAPSDRINHLLTRLRRLSMRRMLAIPIFFMAFALNFCWAADSLQPRTIAYSANVYSVAFSPDGRTVASGSQDKSIKLWDVATERELRALKGHSYWVNSVAFSPDGRTIASGSSDHTIKLWDAATGAELRTLTGHSERVNSVAFSPDGQTIASGGDDTIKLWDAATGAELRTLTGHSYGVISVAFSPDGRTIASGSLDNTIKLWDAATGRELRTLRGHSNAVYSVAFSSGGRVLAASGSEDGTIKLWDARNGQELRTLPGVSGYEVCSVAFSPDGRTLASGTNTFDHGKTLDAINLWDVGSIIGSQAGAEAPPVKIPPGRRVALVVANSAYRDAALDNPAIDAGLVAASLERTGFSVTLKKDLDLDGFEQTIQDFAETARGADVAVFYFAGHGFSVASGGVQQNLLMATSANFSAKTAQALLGGGEPLSHVEETLVHRARATLIFIDACRNIPLLAGRGTGGRGFARLDDDAAEGAYVVLSTRQGKIASDGERGQGSPFARAFASVLPTPGLRIEDATALIREKVRDETGGDQVPDVVRSDLPVGGVILAGTAP